VARSRAYSTGGSTAAGRAKGNFGGAGIGGKRSQLMYVQVFLSTNAAISCSTQYQRLEVYQRYTDVVAGGVGLEGIRGLRDDGSV